jgi:hypothetical protein
MLMRRWERARQGDGQLIQIVGEAGLGKSRLIEEFHARLRDGSAREVAQIGAVIGRDFTYALLRVVAGMEDAQLQTALERLAEADILLVHGVPPDAEYRFKHALIQDAAYENLLKSRRQWLHRRVAEALRDDLSAATAQPELLAHHFTQAGMIDAAIEWCLLRRAQSLRYTLFNIRHNFVTPGPMGIMSTEMKIDFRGARQCCATRERVGASFSAVKRTPLWQRCIRVGRKAVLRDARACRRVVTCKGAGRARPHFNLVGKYEQSGRNRVKCV